MSGDSRLVPEVGTHAAKVRTLTVVEEASRQRALVEYDPLAQTQEEEEVIHLRDYWRVVLKHKWVVCSFLSIIVTATLIATLLMRPVYKATATIQIEEDLPNILKYQELQPERSNQPIFYPTQYKILQSRSLAESVIKKLNLEDNPEINGTLAQRGLLTGLVQVLNALSGTLQAEEGAAGDMGGQAQRSETQRAQQPKYGMPEFVDTFLDKVNIQPERNSKLVKVSFSSFDPKLASQVANAIVSNYIEATLARRYNAGNEAREFLQKQLISMQVALERADQALQDFAKKKNVADLEERIRLATNKLKELNDRLTQVQVENVQFTVLKEQIAKGRADSLEQVMSNELVNKLQEEYVAAAAEYANLSGQFRPGYPKLLQVSEQMSQLEVQINKEKKRIIDSLNTKYSQLVEQDRVLQNAINEQEKQIMGLNQEAIQYNILKREVQTNKELYDGLLQRMKEVGVASGVQENNISVIDRAEVPMDSDKPNKRLNMLVALFLGLAGGIGLAFLLEYLDNTVRRPEDVENLLGLPAIGVIPLDHGRSSRKKARLGDHDISFHSLRKPRSEISEAFRSLRTSLMFSSPSGMPKTLLITSPAASEGKTSASVNLATVLAQSGGRVLLIDADLRRPRMHKVFGTASVPGLTQLIARKDAPTASYFHGTEVSGLLMLPSGIIPPNPPELLGSDAMKALLGELQGLFDYIIIDSAPILGLADALVLSRLVEGVFLITTAGRTSKENLKYAVKRLRQVHTPLLGVVLNAVDMKSPDYYYYYSSHYYHYDSHEAREEPSPKLAHGT